jgi:hypothetical protein
MIPIAGKKVGEFTVSALAMNLAAIPLTLGLAVAMLAFIGVLPHRVPERFLDALVLLPAIFVVFSIHELAHALGLVVCYHVPWGAFRFGFNPRLFIFYCHCQVPLRRDMYRTFALSPLVAVGSLTFLATLAYPVTWLALVTGIHLAGCIGDVWLLAKASRLPKHYLLVDLPDKIGGAIHEPAQSVLQSSIVIH